MRNAPLWGRDLADWSARNGIATFATACNTMAHHVFAHSLVPEAAGKVVFASVHKTCEKSGLNPHATEGVSPGAEATPELSALGLKKEEAVEMKKKLEEIGATVELA